MAFLPCILKSIGVHCSVVAFSACASAQDAPPSAKLSTQPVSAEEAAVIARWARSVGSESRMANDSGKGMYSVSQWGPGRHSVRSNTHGFAADGSPWRALGVAYWHPGEKQVRTLGLDPWDRGVAEGIVKFDGDRSESFDDLYQSRAHRKMRTRVTELGPDKFVAALLEEDGAGEPQPMAEWEYTRSKTITPVTPIPPDKMPSFPERLKAFEPLFAHAWETTTASRRVETTFEWVPLADCIYARVVAPGSDGETHLLDAYLFHHTGKGVLRCLALSESGGVYQGDVTPLDDGALAFELKGFEGERAVSYEARIEFEKGGAGKLQIWSGAGEGRALVWDSTQTKAASK